MNKLVFAIAISMLIPANMLAQHLIPMEITDTIQVPADGIHTIWDFKTSKAKGDESVPAYQLPVVIKEDTVYIGRLAAVYVKIQDKNEIVDLPSAWVKGILKDNKLTLPNAQQICNFKLDEDAEYPVFFTPSTFNESSDSGHTFSSYSYTSYPTKQDLVLNGYDDALRGQTIYGEDSDYGFAFTLSPNSSTGIESITFFDSPAYSSNSEFYYGFPMNPHPRFIQYKSGVKAPNAEVEGKNTLYYDLFGNSYPQVPTSKGIYIHQGKRIIIR